MQMESFELGEHSVHPSLNAVQVNGREIGVESKAMEVLVYLASQPGTVIDKEQIIKAVWPDTFVSDDVLTHAISHLRKALNDDAAHPRFIQTIPRRGYRLIAPVTREVTAEAEQRSAAKLATRFRRSVFALSLSVAALAAVATVLLLNVGNESARTELVNPRAITTALGVEDFPTWRPDGSQLAFESKQAGNFDIWVTSVGGGTPVNLTADHQGDDRWPSWSPDGSQIAFRSERDGGGYFLVPALGGTPRRLIAYGPSLYRQGPPQWSPDGSELAYAGMDKSGRYIEIVSLNRGASRRISLPASAGQPGFELKWAPSGQYFAYGTAPDYGAPTSQICILRVSDSKVFQVTRGDRLDWHPSWSPDSRILYFVSNRGGTTDLWQQRLSADATPDGPAEQLTNGVEMRYAAFSPDGKRLAYSKGHTVSNIWRVPLLSGRLQTWADARQLTFDQSGLANLRMAPDGKHLAFDLFRDGRRHVWLFDLEQGGLQRLTPDPLVQIAPRWSPNGKWIAFHGFDNPDERNIWLAPVGGGALRQLTLRSWDIFPRWSPDGRLIAFDRNRDGNYDVWVVSIETGEAKQLTTGSTGDLAGSWSPDSKEIVFNSSRNGTRDIWIVSVVDGRERQVTSEPGDESDASWSPDGKWILYSSRSGLWRVRATGGRPEPLPEGSHLGFWSRDGAKIYFHLARNGLENFYEIAAEGGAERQLTDFNNKYGEMHSYQTADRFLYFGWEEEMGDVWVMDVAGRR